ncbi:MAG: hypothetical protein WC829_17875 [Hyphomicrobium sp.]|jgi:hypothetical protein
MFKAIVVAAAVFAVSGAGIGIASAETPTSPEQGKTSDRTPGDPSPDRTEGANRSGAAGADAGQTVQGTSDRTPADSASMGDGPSTARGNLFTEQQARMHLARLGYVNISELTKGENGGWRGSAVKDGKKMMVGVDVKGNVATN